MGSSDTYNVMMPRTYGSVQYVAWNTSDPSDEPTIDTLLSKLRTGDHAAGTRKELFEKVIDIYLGLKKARGSELAKARESIRRFFNAQMSDNGLHPEKQKDVESYFVDFVPEEDLFCELFLYTQANFDTVDSNDMVYSFQDLFLHKQGECDDISLFVDHVAKQRGIHGMTLHVLRAYPRQSHVVYYYDQPSYIIMVDNNSYERFDKGKENVTDVWDLLYKCFSTVEKATVLDEEVWGSGDKTEEQLIRHTKSLKKYDYDRASYRPQ